MTREWKAYEDVALYLLDQFAERFGLEGVEGKQGIVGLRSGTEWEIDAKGVCRENIGFVVVECRRYTTSRQSQEKVAGLAYRILDTGANGGIIVSPLGLQEGAEKIAGAENVTSVLLTENSTCQDYVLRFLNQVMVGVSDRISIEESLEMVMKDHHNNVVQHIKK